MSFILKTVSDHVAFITLNRPEKFNSFNREMALALQQALDECMRDDEIRAVHLTAEGKAFCAGQDLSEAMDPDAPSLRSIVHGHYNPIIERIRNIEKPVVCAVNGVAAGAGANIALCCDVVVAVEHATFIQAFSKIGLIPDCGGTFFLPRLIGFQKASALMMMADNIDAKEAERLGMIYKYFPAETFVEESKKIALHLASMPTKALGYTKLALNQSMAHSLTQQLSLEEEYQTACGDTADFDEGIQAFLEKRKANFKGI
ncbi:2-(1,2-epoxy-1,2-dihydrophenyl)acetyl-CoA isomerase [Taibaiella sp. KBW10]|uniref:enoyl-CoA hydratase-related protein n=1 Tax=Taibaiella sp. KBW10 TaxID=2153357 RepID=UPI000F590F91|nr:enoyl-CoA hydratase-related protein [Taibaiella sp. KBW10]RQO31637.1 2-(1,2-epoxy-1,2-dihydrophenyl)acetyl-CoA isomerase [Taibaiella sp. KBW10]